LLAHLQDPATRSKDMPALITALADLGDANAGNALAKFVALYHADPIDSGLARALELAPAVLVKLQGATARPLLSAIAGDELGIYSVRQTARASLDFLAQQAAAARSAAATPPAPAETLAPTPDPNTAQAPPLRITTELIDSALLAVHDQLRACLKENVALLQARVLLVIEDGRAKTVSVLPSELQGCVEPLIRSQEFPKTLHGTPERITYTLKR
jgi:hypothetical protein